MCIKIKNTYFNCALCFIPALNSAVSRLHAAENSGGGSTTARTEPTFSALTSLQRRILGLLEKSKRTCFSKD